MAQAVWRPHGLWRHADFRRLWAGQTISVFGDQITMLALPLAAVLTLDASPGAMGVLTAAGWLPHLLLSLGAGVWIDRRRGRRDLMVAADLLRAAVLASVPLAHAFDALTMAQLYVVAFGVGALTVVFDLAYSSYFVVVVPRAAIVEANAKLMATRSASYIGGPSLAGLLVQALTAPVALAVDALSFVASAALIRRMRTPEPPPDSLADAPLRTRLADGGRFLLRHPVLRPLLACATTLNFFTFVLWGVLVLYFADELGLSAALIGAVFSAGAVGALAGALVAGRLGARFGYGRAVVIGSFLFPAPLVLFALASGPRPLVLAMLVAGEFLSSVGVMLFDVNSNSIQALLTPHRLRARVTGVHRTINYGARPVGALLGGALGGLIGLRPTIAIGAVGATLAVLVALRSPLRSLRELPEEAA
ncbi:MAG: MFS transporter [Thermoleophilia bacterium]|nr:MFS transporter [Thermoleophilia bacterium]